MEHDTRTPLERELERLYLCREVVKEVHSGLTIPSDSDAKADLLIAIEELTIEVFRLRNVINDEVWGQSNCDEEQ
jgi:hypothetical protein